MTSNIQRESRQSQVPSFVTGLPFQFLTRGDVVARWGGVYACITSVWGDADEQLNDEEVEAGVEVCASMNSPLSSACGRF